MTLLEGWLVVLLLGGVVVGAVCAWLNYCRHKSRLHEQPTPDDAVEHYRKFAADLRKRFGVDK